MHIDTTEMIDELLESLSKVDGIHPEDVPNIDLYMDQVTTFMDAHLESSKRYQEDKILTKTMINNYAKNHLLPPPVKKKYSREHVLILIFIYYFKNILSIKDIETVLKPLTGKYFSGESSMDLASIYREICEIEQDRVEPLKETVKTAYEKSMSAFSDLPDGEERDELKLFAFICSLCFDVYLKKEMIEKLIDELEEKKKENKKEKN